MRRDPRSWDDAYPIAATVPLEVWKSWRLFVDSPAPLAVLEEEIPEQFMRLKRIVNQWLFKNNYQAMLTTLEFVKL